MSDVADRTVEFEVRSRFACMSSTAELLSVPPPDASSAEPTVHWRNAYSDAADPQRDHLNKVKSQLDSKDVKSYYAARDNLFPLAQSGSQGAREFFNRAGHKLHESMQVIGVWEHLVKVAKDRQLRRIAFADVCGGPGAFSQLLYATAPKYFKALRGFGMTLYSKGEDTLQWYPELVKSKNFFVTYGVEGTGNIYATENIHSLSSVTATSSLLLVVADGGFDVPFDVANFQETISARIVYGQWLAAVACLQEGGCFVLKLFDTFSPFLQSVLYLSTLCFRRVHIVKPKHSRVVNSERYLVCVGFVGISDSWRSYLFERHANGFTEDTLPLALVPQTWMTGDEAFVATVTKLNNEIAEMQAKALQMVLASPLLVEKSPVAIDAA